MDGLSYDSIRCYTFKVAKPMAMKADTRRLDARSAEMTRHHAGVEIDRQARRLMAGTGLSYVEAFERVRGDPDNADVVKVYSVGPDA